MPNVITCSSCGNRLEIPEQYFGKLVKCPSCNAYFTAESGGHEFDDEEDGPPHLQSQRLRSGPPNRPDDHRSSPPSPPPLPTDSRPAPSKRPNMKKSTRRGSKTQWRRVRLGVTLTIGGLIVPICSGLVTLSHLACIGVMSTIDNTLTLQIMVPLQYFACVSVPASPILTIIGNAFCINAPRVSAARGLAIASLILISAYTLFVALCMLLGFWAAELFGPIMHRPQSAPRMLTAILWSAIATYLLAILCLFGHYLVFQLFMRSTAIIFRKLNLLMSVNCMFVVYLVAILLFLIMTGVSIFQIMVPLANQQLNPTREEAFRAMGALGTFGFCASGVLLITWAVWYMINLSIMRNVLIAEAGA